MTEMNDPLAVLYGLVEGLTEFLPISSTAHLELTTKLLGTPSTDTHKTFEVAIQLGAILSVVVLYWRALLVDWAVMTRVAVAFFPTGVLGLLLHDFVKGHLLGNLDVVLWALLLGGLFLVVFEALHREKPQDREGLARITYPQAFLIGVCQALAMIPGVSRSAATVIGGLALGVKRKTSVEFSFVLAVPTIAAATCLVLYKQYRDGGGLSGEESHFLAIGFATSFVVALMTIHFLLRFVKTHTFLPFGVYRIGLVLVFWGLLAAGMVSR
jgi:undecaprenyl-diphosphatase